MKRRKKARGLRYKLDYIAFWKTKGIYGQTRIDRMRERKRRRFEKWFERKKQRKYGPWWQNGRMVQWCEYPEGSICDYPCNGDC